MHYLPASLLSSSGSKRRRFDQELEVINQIENAVNTGMASLRAIAHQDYTAHSSNEFEEFGRNIAAQLQAMSLSEARICQDTIVNIVNHHRNNTTRNEIVPTNPSPRVVNAPPSIHSMSNEIFAETIIDMPNLDPISDQFSAVNHQGLPIQSENVNSNTTHLQQRNCDMFQQQHCPVAVEIIGDNYVASRDQTQYTEYNMLSAENYNDREIQNPHHIPEISGSALVPEENNITTTDLQYNLNQGEIENRSGMQLMANASFKKEFVSGVVFVLSDSD